MRADYGEPCRAKNAKWLLGYEQVANANYEYSLGIFLFVIKIIRLRNFSFIWKIILKYDKKQLTEKWS